MLGGLAFIGALLCGGWLGGSSLVSNAKIKARNREYELDQKTHNYNKERQAELKDKLMYSQRSLIDGESWTEKWLKYNINDDIMRDLEAIKIMNDEGYDYEIRSLRSFNCGLCMFPEYKGMNIWHEKPWWQMTEEERNEVKNRIGAVQAKLIK